MLIISNKEIIGRKVLDGNKYVIFVSGYKEATKSYVKYKVISTLVMGPSKLIV